MIYRKIKQPWVSIKKIFVSDKCVFVSYVIIRLVTFENPMKLLEHKNAIQLIAWLDSSKVWLMVDEWLIQIIRCFQVLLLYLLVGLRSNFRKWKNKTMFQKYIAYKLWINN